MPVNNKDLVIRGPKPYQPLSKDCLGRIIYDSLLQNYTRNKAMIDIFTGNHITYKQILDDSCHLAEALRIYNYTLNSTVISICSENNLQFYTPVLAALFVGAIVAPVNNNYSIQEMKHMADICKPKVMFCSKNVVNNIVNLKKGTDCIERIVVINSNEKVNGTETLEEFIWTALGNRPVPYYNFLPFNGNAEKHPAFILCSSGTTGLPKGVLLSHLNVGVRINHTRDPRYTFGKKHTSNGLMPFFHGYGLHVGLNAIINSHKMIVFQRFDEDVFLKAIQDYELEVLTLAPPLAVLLSKSPKVLKYDLSSVKDLACGAAPLSKDTEIALKKRFKVNLFRQAYGLTETTLAVTMFEGSDVKEGSVGKMVTFMKGIVRDPETGKLLGPNEVGELCFKGPMVMLGYYNNKKATEESFTEDGWLRSGDLGYYDDEEYFYIVDRLKELIKYKGFQVAPAELEAILLSHPKVQDAAVVGLPDELSGELPLAFIVKIAKTNVTEREIQEYVAKSVSPQKKLRGGVIFVSSIPKNPSGKILRRELRSRLKDRKVQRESKL